MRSLLLFVGVGLLLMVSLNYAMDSLTLQHFIYHHVSGQQYSVSEVSCDGQYYVVSISGQPHLIVTDGKYDLPVLVKNKKELKQVLVCYYELNVQDPVYYLNQSKSNLSIFINSTHNEYYSDNCLKFLGLHKSWCNDTESCRLVCFQKGTTCQPVMLSLRWDFLDAMQDYSETTVSLQNSMNQSYSFDTPLNFKKYVDGMAVISSSKKSYMDNPILNRWRFCGLAEYDWQSIDYAHDNALKAYYSRYPAESLNSLSDDLIENTDERVFMFKFNNFFNK